MRRLTCWNGRVLTTIARALERSNRRDQGRAPAPWLVVVCGAALCVCRARRAMHVRAWPWRADRGAGRPGAPHRGGRRSESSMHTLTRFWVVYVLSVAVVRLLFLCTYKSRTLLILRASRSRAAGATPRARGHVHFCT